MNSNEFAKGDILKARLRSQNEGLHYIVKYSSNTELDFIGAMLSTKNYKNRNAPMEARHFKIKDDSGKNFRIIYKNSHLVPAKLIKPEIWGRFKKVGELTNSGIHFTETIIQDLHAITFEEYLNSI